MTHMQAMRTRGTNAGNAEASLSGPSGWGGLAGRPSLERELGRHHSGWVYACIRTVASRLASLPVRVGKKKAAASTPGRRRSLAPRKPARPAIPKGMPAGLVKSASEGVRLYDAHPVLDALARPNPFTSWPDMAGLIVASLLTAGETYLWCTERDDDPRGYALWVLPPSWVTPVHDDEAGSLFKCFTVRPRNTGTEFQVAGDEMLRLASPDPENPLFGVISPLLASVRSVLADEAIEESQRAGFANGLNPGLALIVGRLPEVSGVDPGVPMTLTRDQRSVLTMAVKQMYSGVAKNGEPLILDGFIKDAKKITNTVREMDFLESGKATKNRITQAFGVNPISMGEVEGSNRASSAVADEHLVANAVNPLACLISHGLTAYFSRRTDQPDLMVWVEEARPHDAESRRAEVDLGCRFGLLTRDEARAELGFDPLPDGQGGDELVTPQGGRSARPAPDPDQGGAA
ncbi:MAG: phage portal protein, partial [Gemmataceae bacterium]